MLLKVKVLLFFSVFFAAGLTLFFSISEELLIQRDPAAIDGKVFQISELTSAQIQKQLSQKIKIQTISNDQKSLRLEGFSSAVCKTYSHIELGFEAEGMAVAGMAPQMTVKGICEPGQDPAEMASIVIPLSMILAEKPRNAEFRFDGYNARFEFKNSSDEWPRTWVLKTVDFKSETNGDKRVQLSSDPTQKNNPLVVLEF